MIEYRFHICADLTYFLLAHIKVKNAADTYDEDKEEFITPFCVLLDEWEQPYTNYWKQKK